MDQFKRLPVLFLHFFDTHFLELQTRGRDRAVVAKECRLATRFAYLAAEVLYVPAASYFESELCREIIDEFQPIFECGFIFLVGGGANILEFIEEKRAQYKRSSTTHRLYFEDPPPNLPPYKNRTKSATKQIVKEWREHLEAGKAPELFDGTNLKVPKQFETNWGKVPDRLGQQAFIMDHVRPHLLKNVEHRTVLSRTQEIIDKAYFESFTSEYDAGVVREFAYLETAHRVPSSGRDLSFRFLVLHTRRSGLLDSILEADAFALEQIRHDPPWVSVLAAYFATLPVPPGLEAGILLGQAGNGTQEKQPVQPSARVQAAPAPTIGIITALPKEFVAVEILLENARNHNVPGSGAGRRYKLGEVTASEGGSHRIILAILPDMANNLASIAATLMQERFPTVETIIMTGIAGGAPNPDKVENHVRLGDIVVSNRNGVVQYDNIKRERLEDIVEDKVRAAPRAPSAKMVEAVRFLDIEAYKGNKPWLPLIAKAVAALNFNRPPDNTDILHHTTKRDEEVNHPNDPKRTAGEPRLFQGAVGSANILLKDPVLRDYLRDKFGIMAIEMEGSGVSDATWHQENGYIVVRGICDYCDMSKGDAWQDYAAAVAAGYTVALIASLPVMAPGDLGSIAEAGGPA